MDIVEKSITFIAFALFFVDVFVNLPMNGVYRLPGNWNKDNTIMFGLLATLILSTVLVYNGFVIPLWITIPYVILYFKTNYVHLMTIINLFRN